MKEILGCIGIGLAVLWVGGPIIAGLIDCLAWFYIGHEILIDWNANRFIFAWCWFLLNTAVIGLFL